MGDFEDAIDKIGFLRDKDKEAVKQFKKLIDDVKVTYPLVGTIISFFEMVLTWDDKEKTINDVLNILIEGVNEIIGILGEIENKIRLSDRILSEQNFMFNLDTIYTAIRAARDRAVEWLEEKDEEEKNIKKGQFITASGIAQEAMASYLNDDPYFKHYYLEELLYHSEVYGCGPTTMKPNDCPEGLGLIYDPFMTLPFYLEGLTIMTFVIQVQYPKDFSERFANEPDFKKNNFILFCDKLIEIHDNVRNNIKELPLPLFKNLYLEETEHWENEIYEGKFEYKNKKKFSLAQGPYDIGGVECISGEACVEKYSPSWKQFPLNTWEEKSVRTDFQIESGSSYDFTEWHALSSKWYKRFCAVHAIRSHKKKMEVYYATVVLPSIWDFQNDIREIVGDPPIEADYKLRAWSIRELANMIYSNISPELLNQPISMKSILTALYAPMPPNHVAPPPPPPMSIRSWLLGEHP